MTTLPLQAAILARLTAPGSPLLPLIGNRVYDRPPRDAAGRLERDFPYVVIGDLQAGDDGADCVPGEEVAVTIHAWSRAVGSVEAKQINAALLQALHEVDLDLGADAALVELRWQRSFVIQDPDGLTSHGVNDFLALTERV